MIRRLWLRMRTPCAVFPCKRCDKAWRILTESREEWHRARRAKAYDRAEYVMYGAILGLLAAGIYEAVTR